MQLYIYCDTSKLEDEDMTAFISHGKKVITKLEAFLLENDQLRGELHSDIDQEYAEDIKIGLDFHVKKPKQLEKPLNFFNDLSKEYKLDFVLGLFTDGKPEDVCFFGFEEGKGDSFMISRYVGL